jgi:threonine/homoserine/homoserine lactone efflux protein
MGLLLQIGDLLIGIFILTFLILVVEKQMVIDFGQILLLSLVLVGLYMLVMDQILIIVNENMQRRRVRWSFYQFSIFDKVIKYKQYW